VNDAAGKRSGRLPARSSHPRFTWYLYACLAIPPSVTHGRAAQRLGRRNGMPVNTEVIVLGVRYAIASATSDVKRLSSLIR
jgi:hypothetical protein